MTADTDANVIRVLIMGAAGRDFHNFQVAYRDDPAVEVVAFTATQIPGIDSRTYPAAIAGPLYPNGIPIHPESELPRLENDARAGEVLNLVGRAPRSASAEQVS